MQLVDQTGLQVLADRVGPTGQAHVLAVGRGEGLLQGRLDAVVDEGEACAAFHLQDGLRFVGQDEDRVVVGWIRSPPTGPRILVLDTRGRSEHVTTHDAGADVVVGLGEEVVVDALGPSALPEHGVDVLGRPRPAHQAKSVLAEGCLLALPRGGTESIEGDGETANDKLRHEVPFDWDGSLRSWVNGPPRSAGSVPSGPFGTPTPCSGCRSTPWLPSTAAPRGDRAETGSADSW